MARMQISPGIAHSPSRLCLSDLRHSVLYKYWALVIMDTSPRYAASSASCTSGQRFAFGFLQIRSRPRHPCRSANSSPCRASRGLAPPSKCALLGAPKKNATDSVAQIHTEERDETTSKSIQCKDSVSAASILNADACSVVAELTSYTANITQQIQAKTAAAQIKAQI